MPRIRTIRIDLEWFSVKTVIALTSLKWARVKTECVQKGLIPGRCLSNNNYGCTATHAFIYVTGTDRQMS